MVSYIYIYIYRERERERERERVLDKAQGCGLYQTKGLCKLECGLDFNKAHMRA
jgi:hypothetical protein